jgi:hypothetical protein
VHVAALPTLYLPPGHSSQPNEPEPELLYRPAAHDVQYGSDANAANLPLLQAVHWDKPALL